MSEKQKILKIKIGEVYIDGKTTPVFQTAWRRTSKKGEEYFETSQQIFVNEIEKKHQPSKPTL